MGLQPDRFFSQSFITDKRIRHLEAPLLELSDATKSADEKKVNSL